MGVFDRAGTAAVLAGLALVVTGCSSEAPPASAVPGPSASPSAPGAAEPGAAEPGGAEDCDVTRPADVTPERAAACVRQGWATNDVQLVEAYGSPGVTDPLPVVRAEIEMTPEGCVGGEPGETICSWSIEHSEGVAVVRFHVTDTPDGSRVTSTDATR